MPEMSAARGTLDLGAVPIRIQQLFDSPRDGVVETGPAAACVKFIVGLVEKGTTLATDVGSIFKEIIIFSTKRTFGAFMQDDMFFFGRKRFHLGHNNLTFLLT